MIAVYQDNANDMGLAIIESLEVSLQTDLVRLKSSVEKWVFDRDYRLRKAGSMIDRWRRLDQWAESRVAGGNEVIR